MSIGTSLLTTIGAVSLALIFLVETLTWFLRANALSSGRAYVISKSNLILYTSRLFSFTFQFSVSYYIESVKSGNGIILLCVFGFAGTALAHLIIFYYPPLRQLCWRSVVYCLNALNRWSPETMSPQLPAVKTARATSLLVATAASTIIFAVAITLPYLLAQSNPDFRLTLTSLIQFLNFLGTLFLLYFVDPILFRLMDSEKLRDSIYEYIGGRVAGFAIAALMAPMALLLI